MESGIGEPEVGSEVAKRVLRRAAITGCVGAVFGGVLSTFRNASALMYATSMGTNYFLLSGSYFGVLEACEKTFPDYKGKWEMHCGVGALTGSTVAILFAGKRKAIPGALLFSAIGVGGFFASEAFESWRLEKGRAMYEQEKKSLAERSSRS